MKYLQIGRIINKYYSESFISKIVLLNIVLLKITIDNNETS